MDTNNHLELEQMRAQLGILKQKLEKQDIVNERLMRKSMKSKMSWINKYLVIVIFAIPFVAFAMLPMVHEMNISWWWYGFTLVMMTGACAEADLRLVSRLVGLGSQCGSSAFAILYDDRTAELCGLELEHEVVEVREVLTANPPAAAAVKQRNDYQQHAQHRPGYPVSGAEQVVLHMGERDECVLVVLHFYFECPGLFAFRHRFSPSFCPPQSYHIHMKNTREHFCVTEAKFRKY